MLNTLQPTSFLFQRQKSGFTTIPLLLSAVPLSLGASFVLVGDAGGVDDVDDDDELDDEWDLLKYFDPGVWYDVIRDHMIEVNKSTHSQLSS